MSRRSRSLRASILAGLLLLLGLLFPDVAQRLQPVPHPLSPFEQGEQHLRQGQLYQAELAFRRALEEPATSNRAAGRLGLLALIRGDDAAAEEPLRAVVQTTPEEAVAWACLGLFHARRGEGEAAVDAWSRSVEQPGPHFLALGLRGEERYLQGEMAAARADFTALLGEGAAPEWVAWAHLRLGILDAPGDPSTALAYLQAAQQPAAGWEGDWFPSPEQLYGRPAGERARRAEELAGLLLSLAGRREPERALAIGQMLLGQMDAAGAAWVLERAVALAPEDVRALAHLGWAHSLAGLELQGLHELHTALVRAPGDPLVQQLLARAYAARGWLRAARNELEQALSISPNAPVILLDLARVAQQSGDYQEAAGLIEQAFVQSAGTGTAPLYALLRARFYLDNGWSLCEQGKEAAEALLRFAPEAAEVWRIRGRVLAGCGRPEEALVALEKAIAMDPTSAEAFDALGQLYLGLGRREAAGHAFAEAADREPWSRWSRHARAWLEGNR